MNARRFPRTMEEAFGPYHRSGGCPIEPMPTPSHPMPLADKAVYIACAIGFIAALAACYFT